MAMNPKMTVYTPMVSSATDETLPLKAASSNALTAAPLGE